MAKRKPKPDAETCLVTGAGGFIGSHLTHRLLNEGYAVRAFVRYNAAGSIGHLEEVRALGRERGEAWIGDGRLEIVHGDVMDERCAREAARGCRQVFHLAALIGIPYSYRAPASYVAVNVGGALNVLEACRESKPERVIMTSTSEVYGTARRVPIDEDHPIQTHSPYAASKAAADRLAEAYYRSFDVPVVTLRPFNTYGPRQSARAIVPTILAQALSSECREIQLGSLHPVRDLTYVEDTVAGFVALAKAPLERVVGQVYNLGSGEGVTIEEIAKRALKAAGVDKPIVSREERKRPEKSEVERLICDATKLSSDMNHNACIQLDEGLRRTAAWLRENPKWIDASVYRV